MSETMTEPSAATGEIEARGKVETFILCELAGATYGIPSRDIAHLEMVGSITPVPNAPDFVEGVASARGQVIPVVNLRTRFGFPKRETTLRARLIIVRSGSRSVGLLVDGAHEFASIPVEAIQPPPDDIAVISGDYLEGLAHLGERLVLILRTAQLLEIEVVHQAPNPLSATDGSEN